MKKGISLIVLIVTIIVIIILAAAVILTLNKNNPIDSSRVSQLADNRASLNSAIQLYYGKVMAETQGIFQTKDIFKGNNADLNGTKVAIPQIVGAGLTTDSPYCKLTTKSGTNTITEEATNLTSNPIKNGIVIVDIKKGEAADKAKLKKGDVIISIDDKEIKNISYFKYELFLAYTAKTDLPNWMFTDSNRTTIDSTLNTFVRVVKNNDLVEYSKA